MGVMSGTSLDNIDVVVAKFFPLQIYDFFSHPIPPSVKSSVMNALSNPSFSMHDMMKLNQQWVNLYSEAILMSKSRRKLSICAVGLHGQTVYHRPDQFGTWQLGTISSISATCGMPVIGDFRSKDIALGGEGAPLAPLFHQAFFASEHTSRGIINLGGIANISRLVPGRPVEGYDVGPANALLDAYSSAYLKKPYDHNGDFARQGQLIPSLLNKMLSDPYFSSLPPKSTGRDYFSLGWLQSMGIQGLDSLDIMATLVEMVAILLARASTELGEVYYCGGGIKNAYLMERIQHHVGLPIKLTTELGIVPQMVEALGFAWLASEYNLNNKHDLSTITGSKHPHVLGVCSL